MVTRRIPLRAKILGVVLRSPHPLRKLLKIVVMMEIKIKGWRGRPVQLFNKHHLSRHQRRPSRKEIHRESRR